MVNSIMSLRYAMEPLRTIVLANIPAAYDVTTGAGALTVPMGAPNHAGLAALLYPARQWMLQNNTNGYLYFSINGIDDNGSLLPGQGFVNDIGSNKTGVQLGSSAWALSAGDIVYIRYPYAAPTGPAVGAEVTFSVSYGGE
jgi:hypothetical protein